MTKEKPPYLEDDDFLMLFFKAAVDFGSYQVRLGNLKGVDSAYPFVDWLYKEADTKAPDRREYWNAVNKNYDTTSSDYGQKKDFKSS